MSAPSQSSSRHEALDFTKGILVVCMVAYHSLNYSTRPELGFRWLAFLPPSFIMITGFLIAGVYFARPREHDRATRSRLWTRGAKLLVLFTGLNLLVNLVKKTNYNGQPLGLEHFIRHTPDIYLVGSGSFAAFEVLLPIAYLLLLGPLWLALERCCRAAIPLVAGLLVVACVLLEQRGLLVPNVGFMSAGLVGLVLGQRGFTALDVLRRFWWVGLGAYAAYAAVTAFVGQSYVLQMLGALLALAALYGVGARLGGGWIQKRICVMGNYSLVSYIAQIGLLQVLVRLTGRPEPGSVLFWVVFALTLAAMSLGAELIQWARGKSGVVDKGYRLAFA